MSAFNSLVDFLKGNHPKKDTPDGYCPNCWGRAEYGGKFFDAVKTNNVDVNTQDERLGWIQEYANKHLIDIELKQEDNDLVCQKCKLTYRPTRESGES